MASCAIREAPKGGPEDKTPPSIIGVDPPEGSVNLPPDASFTISFSKSMQRDFTQSAIFLSPVFWGYPTFSWSGRKLTVKPPENLRANTTYILTIGAGATDIHTNKMGSSRSYAFSTGPAIDSSLVSGAIFSTDGSRQVYDIWAYALGDTGVAHFWNRIPDYATQVDSIGGFRIEHLGSNTYFVIAVNDKNDDLFWDPSSEEIALPPGLVRLKGEGQVRGMILQPARRDTATCYITRANPLSQQRLAVEFSSQPRTDIELSRFSYRIRYDTDSILGFAAPYIGEGGALIMETDRQTKGTSYQLMPLGLVNNWGVPFDTAGIRFTGTEIPDTSGPRLMSSYPPNASTSTYEDSVIEMTFSKRIQVLTFPTAVSVVADSTDTLQFSPTWIAPNQVRLRFAGRIPRQKKVTVSLQTKKILDGFQNPMPDSSLTISFRLPPEDTVGNVAATLEQGQMGNIVGILTEYGKAESAYKGHFNKAGELSIQSVLPGVYRFEYFDDADSNGIWSPGVVMPFKPSERFAFLADTVKVRSRWTTEIGSVSLPNLGQ